MRPYTTSETLKVCGLVGCSLALAYIVLPTLLGSKKKTKRELKRHTTGLVNYGNTCYANSVFQALAGQHILLEYLKANTETSAANEFVFNFLSELAKEGDKPHTASAMPMMQFIEAFYHAKIQNVQHDAHELLLKVLEIIETVGKLRNKKQDSNANASAASSNDADTANSSTNTDNTDSEVNAANESHASNTANEANDIGTILPFEGRRMQRIECTKCHKVTTTESEFFVIENTSDNKDVLTPSKDVINDYKCDQCGPTVITMTNYICVLPAMFAIHINRSIFGNGVLKSTKSVPIKLSIHGRALSAIIFHKGSHASGHYYCARRKLPAHGAEARNKYNWWLISDSHVDEASTDQVLAKACDAYLLFYELERMIAK